MPASPSPRSPVTVPMVLLGMIAAVALIAAAALAIVPAVKGDADGSNSEVIADPATGTPFTLHDSDPDVIAAAVTSSDPTVRSQVAGNPNLTAGQIHALANDPDSGVRCAALYNVAVISRDDVATALASLPQGSDDLDAICLSSAVLSAAARYPDLVRSSAYRMAAAADPTATLRILQSVASGSRPDPQGTLAEGLLAAYRLTPDTMRTTDVLTDTEAAYRLLFLVHAPESLSEQFHAHRHAELLIGTWRAQAARLASTGGDVGRALSYYDQRFPQ